MIEPPRRPGDPFPDPPLPLALKLWFVFCAIVGVSAMVMFVWLVAVIVQWIERQP